MKVKLFQVLPVISHLNYWAMATKVADLTGGLVSPEKLALGFWVVAVPFYWPTLPPKAITLIGGLPTLRRSRLNPALTYLKVGAVFFGLISLGCGFQFPSGSHYSPQPSFRYANNIFRLPFKIKKTSFRCEAHKILVCSFFTYAPTTLILSKTKRVCQYFFKNYSLKVEIPSGA